MNCQQAAGKIFNIGSDEEISIEALADRIIAMTASKSTKEFLSYEKAYGRPIEDMMRRVPNIRRIRQTIGWKPRTSLAEALEIVIQSFK